MTFVRGLIIFPAAEIGVYVDKLLQLPQSFRISKPDGNRPPVRALSVGKVKFGLIVFTKLDR